MQHRQIEAAAVPAHEHRASTCSMPSKNRCMSSRSGVLDLAQAPDAKPSRVAHRYRRSRRCAAARCGRNSLPVSPARCRVCIAYADLACPTVPRDRADAGRTPRPARSRCRRPTVTWPRLMTRLLRASHQHRDRYDEAGLVRESDVAFAAPSSSRTSCATSATRPLRACPTRSAECRRRGSTCHGRSLCRAPSRSPPLRQTHRQESHRTPVAAEVRVPPRAAAAG